MGQGLCQPIFVVHRVSNMVIVLTCQKYVLTCNTEIRINLSIAKLQRFHIFLRFLDFKPCKVFGFFFHSFKEPFLRQKTLRGIWILSRLIVTIISKNLSWQRPVGSGSTVLAQLYSPLLLMGTDPPPPWIRCSTLCLVCSPQPCEAHPYI